MKKLVNTEEANSIADCGLRNAELIKMPAKQVAEHFRVSVRTIERWYFAGKLKGEFVDSGKGYGKGGQVLMVWIDPPTLNNEELRRAGDTVPEPTIGTRKIFPGEPGCRVVTELRNGEPVLNPVISDQSFDKLRMVSEVEPLSVTSDKIKNLPAINKENLPQDVIRLPEKVVSEKARKKANLCFALIEAFQQKISNSKTKTETIQRHLDLYNSGAWLPDIHKELGSRSKATLYNWLQLYEQGGIDGLIPAYNGNAISRVTVAEKQFLRQYLLNQNKPKIAYAIRKCKFILGDQSSSSPATLRRYVKEFKAEYYDVWTLDREGKKAWNDKCASYATRAWWTLKVGEILVADGHKLNFQIINPHTGKPSRAVLVMFWDWYSSYPVGWEVMLTENVQCVATALRNAIITLGKTPECVYLDNGKAFKAKCFTKKIVLEETEIPGMFARLGIDTMFAMKYNAQAKPIERIFGVLEWLERELDSFTGASINDKPANLRPNEDRAKKLRGDFTPRLDQVNGLIRQWRDFYASQPLRGRKNQTAQELFDPGRGPGVDPKALCFLMMKAEIKRVFRERLTFEGFDWTGDCLYGLNSRVLVRYSLSDRGQIYVFSLQEKFLGIVTPVIASAPRDHEAARRTISERNQALRQTKALSALAKKASPETIDLLTRKHPELIEYIQKEETKKEPPKFSPFLAPQAESPIDKPEVCVTDPEARPFFDYDHEKYEWLQAHPDQVTNLDREWIEDFFSRNSLYRNAARG